MLREQRGSYVEYKIVSILKVVVEIESYFKWTDYYSYDEDLF